MNEDVREETDTLDIDLCDTVDMHIAKRVTVDIPAGEYEATKS